MGKRSPTLKPGEREPTFAEWHEILTEIVDPSENLVQQTMEYFLRTTQSGQAYLEGAKRLRPNLKIDADLDLDQVLATYDAMTLLETLIAEPRCGTDPTFRVWRDIWSDSMRGPSSEYTLTAEIARVLEGRSESETERARLEQVRAALEDEYRLEVRFQEERDFRHRLEKPKSKR